ncbi:hypothetical protein ES708_31605 [subsurface metagenome]
MVKDTYFIFMTPRNKAKSYGEFTVSITKDELDVDEVKTVCATATQYPLAESDLSDEFEFTLDTTAPEMIEVTGTWKIGETPSADEGNGTLTVTFSEELDKYEDADALGWSAIDMIPKVEVALSFANAELTEETDVVEVEFTTLAGIAIPSANAFVVLYDNTDEKITDLAGNLADESFEYCYLEIEEEPVPDPTNEAPVITSIPDVTVTAGEGFSYAVVAIDPDDGDTLTYSVTVFPATTPAMVINADTGVIIWIPPVTLEDYIVNVMVTDDEGLSDFESFTITVTPSDFASLTISASEIGTGNNEFEVVVTACDDFGNVKTDYIGTVEFSTTADDGQEHNDKNFSLDDGGVYTFTLTVIVADYPLTIGVRELEADISDEVTITINNPA